jgi:putative addiction module component (TIGR02574 family)
VTAALKKITDDLLKLPPEDRVSVAEALIASLPELEDARAEEAWEKELDKRLDAYEAGETETLPSRESHARALSILNEARRASRNRNT